MEVPRLLQRWWRECVGRVYVGSKPPLQAACGAGHGCEGGAQLYTVHIGSGCLHMQATAKGSRERGRGLADARTTARRRTFITVPDAREGRRRGERAHGLVRGGWGGLTLSSTDVSHSVMPSISREMMVRTTMVARVSVR